MSETENNELTAGKQSKEPRSNQKLNLSSRHFLSLQCFYGYIFH